MSDARKKRGRAKSEMMDMPHDMRYGDDINGGEAAEMRAASRCPEYASG